MTSNAAMAEAAALVGDPARAGMLNALMDGRALTATELAGVAGITAQTDAQRQLETACNAILAALEDVFAVRRSFFGDPRRPAPWHDMATLNALAADASAAVASVDCGMRLYDAIQAAFECMPLATLIRKDEQRVFVVHGGLPRAPDVPLPLIAAIARQCEIPYGYEDADTQLYEDLLWSDPRPGATPTPPALNARGAGIYFGANVTNAFCALNNVSLVVRSHECVQEGFAYMHDRRLMTVFSASHYCARDTNKGAYISFDASLGHVIQQFVPIVNGEIGNISDNELAVLG
jgi:diadenosine tetraphosphatase ApaH/serine/threonine PP2A family protein phosphatase